MRPDHALPPVLVPIAASLLVGASLGESSVAGPAALGLLAAMLAAACARSGRRTLAALACIAAAGSAGAALQGAAWLQAERRVARAFGGERTVEAQLTARVLAAPERGLRGERRVRATIVAPPRMTGLRVAIEIADVPPDDAGRIDALRRGDVVAGWCRLKAPGRSPGVGERDARRRLASQRLDATGRIKSARLVVLLARGPATPARAIDRVHAAARASLDRSFGASTRPRAVLGAFLLGDRALVDPETESVLRDAGLVHLLSISGLHTGMCVLALVFLLRRSRLGPAGVLVAGAGALAAFCALVGHGAAVWRAAAGAGATLLARALGREIGGLPALALAAGALVVAVPPLIWNLGFVLSVAATAGLLAAIERSRHEALAASAGAYAASAPVLAGALGRLAPAGLVSNLLAAPLCGACLVTGGAALAFGWIPGVGRALAWCAVASTEALMATARAAAAIPGGHLRVATPSRALVAAYVAFLLAAWLRPGRGSRLGWALCAIALHLGVRPIGTGDARVVVLDVGQGLAVILRGPEGRCVLADAGPSAGGRFDAGDRIVVPRLIDAGCGRLDALVLSHDHDDHAGGARAVLRDMDVGELWLAAGSERDPLARDLAADAVRRGVAVRRLARGDVATIAGFDVAILHPAIEDRWRPINDRCLVVRAASCPGASILLPGDVEADAERTMVEREPELRADALVVPHHGAAGSSTPGFLGRVGARWAVVSAGAGNRFGHPAAGTLARLQRAGASVLRTDRDGSVTLIPSAGSWTVSLEDERRGDEREREHRSQQHGDRDPPPAEGRGLVEEPGVTSAEEQEDHEPERVRRDDSRDEDLPRDEARRRRDRQPRQKTMPTRRDGEESVPSVELADREEVHRGDEHPHPGRAVDGVDLERGASVEKLLEDEGDQRRPEPAVDLRVGWKLDRPGDSDHENRECDDESRDRTGGRDVEQGPPARDRPPDADHRAERADDHGKARDEERERRRNAVGAAGEVVTHLVSAEDRQEQRRIGDPVRESPGIEQGGPGKARVPRSLPDPASGHGGRENRRREEPRVEPEDAPTRRDGERVGHEPSIRLRSRTARELRRGHRPGKAPDRTPDKRYECC